MRARFTDLVDMLARRGADDDRNGFVFLDDGEREGPALSFRALHTRAAAIAACLQDRGLAGERALLMYPPGLDFIAAFFGCVYAGAIAVPVYPPDPSRMDRSLERLDAIASDADARALLSTDAVLSLAEHVVPAVPRLAALARIATDAAGEARARDWRRPAVRPESTAFLQYTSGSTSSPRGVVVSHANLMHNQVQIEAALRRDASTTAVNWLPMFHDMGLIGAVLQPIYNGARSWLMSPLDVVARPARWLRAVSRYRAHTSGGPNFAYDLCVRKVREEDCAGLDLSSWEIAFSGAEPVRADTLARFAARFGPRGFKPRAFYPCYGLAEATLFVAGRASLGAPTVLALDADALARGRAVIAGANDAQSRAYVSCGHAWEGQSLAIAAPDGARCAEGVVGEVAVRGPSVASGYFRRAEESAATFGARIDGEGPYLLTGDLGFLRDGELYITGRKKDVIIVAGRNHYPQDLEATIERADERVRRGCTAAFAVTPAPGGGGGGGEAEGLAAVAEVDERRGPVDADAITAAVRSALAREHGLRLRALALVRAGTIPKTTSGKIRRSACRGEFEAGSLDAIARWQAAPEAPSVASAAAAPGAFPAASRAPSYPAAAVLSEPQARIVARVSQAIRSVLGDSRGVDLAPAAPLAHLGLDSLQVLEVKSAAEGLLGTTVPVAWLEESRTLADLAVLIEARAGGERSKRHAPEGGDDDDGPDPWSTYVNPYVARQLRAFRLDKKYVRGSGCFVEDDAGRRYLDFTAAYGALPFGFNPEEIWDAVRAASFAAPATLVQPSLLDAAGRLAARLVELAPAGLCRVTFANSGAEAIEAAIKLARSATGRLGIVSAVASFHGKTLGALSATGRASHQRAFGAPAPGFTHVPFGDLDALADLLAREGERTAAVLLEPIQGEGGIHVAPAGYLRGVRALCDRHGVLLVLDEVQTGLGRTGALFACEHEGVVPDVMALAKALGGGIVPVGAVLSTAACFNEEFALRHSSTFAGNALASLVGLRSLELLTRDGAALVRHVAEAGAALRDGLLALQRRYPGLIREVRGRGFMLGIELTDDHGDFGRQGVLAAMAEQSTLGYLLCSYLLNVEGVRLAPALLGSSVLRIEPPLVATLEQCRAVLAALERAFALLEACDSEALLGHLIGHRPAAARAVNAPEHHARVVPRRSVARPSPGSGEGRWGFVFHPLDHHSYVDFDAALAGFDDAGRRVLMDRLRGAALRDTPSTLLIGSSRIESPTGASAYGELFAVTATAEELVAMPSHEAVARVREAVLLARDRGAKIVGLGAYSSIVTKNGAWLGDAGVPLTTGNGLTVVAAVDSVLRAASALDRPLGVATVAVVGATGSIGRAVAMELAPLVGRLVLVGNPAHARQAADRLRQIAEDVVSYLAAATTTTTTTTGRGALGAALSRVGSLAPSEAARRLVAEGRIELCAEAGADLRAAAVVVTATSSPHAVLTSGQLGHGAVVCDIARPPNVGSGLAAERPDVLLLEGGGVSLPGGRDLGVSFGLAPGLAYACMAETALLALDGRYRNGSLGHDLPHELITALRACATRHDFQVVPARDGRPLDRAAWERAIEQHRAFTR